ncbi:MAG: response regulator [Fibrobacter sp.]|nr:response regulator [Fibrobacter sp.]
MDESLLKDKIILIVDDYAVNTELLSLFVTDAGANPITACNGLECIEIVKKQQVDMILMDKNMPVMNGLDTTRALRQLPEGKNLLIIGISGNDSETDEKECLDAGMNCVVPKLTLNDVKLIKLAASLLHTQNGSAENEPDQPSALNNDPAEQSTPDQIMDYEKALREFENDRDLLDSLVVEFNQIVQKSAQSMKQALEASDVEYLQTEAHGIKGGAANLRALPLAEAAKALENACKTNAQSGEIARLFDIFMSALAQFDSFVNNRLH